MKLLIRKSTRLGLTTGFLLVFILGCEREPSPLKPDATLPGPQDRSLFEPETLAVFDQATAKVRAMPTAQNWAELAYIYHAHEQLDDAITCYQEALKAGDQTNRTPHLLALALDETGNRTEALRAMELAANRPPAYSPSFWKRGQWQLEQGDAEAAAISMQAALDANPQDLTTRLAVGKFLLDTNQPQHAAQIISNVVQQVPQDRYAHYLFGVALSQLGNTVDSAAHLELGRHSKPYWRDRHHDNLRNLLTGPGREFTILSLRSNRDNARETLEKLLALEERMSDDVNYYIQLTKNYRMLVQLDNAEQMIKTGLALNEHNYQLHYQQAGLYIDRWRIKGEPLNDPLLDAALKKIDYTISLNPTSATSHALRAKVLNFKEQYDQSAAAWQKADQLDTEHNHFAYRSAKVYLDQEQWLKAEPILIELVDRYPYDVTLLRKLAMTQYAAGKWPEAQKSLTKYQSTQPNDPEVNAALRKIDGS